MTAPTPPRRSWWHRQHRPYDKAEMLADALVHVIGLLIAISGGAALLIIAAVNTAPEAVPALAVYVATFVAVMSISMAFNLWPVSAIKMLLARLDQALIFLFAAGTYTPFLVTMEASAFTRTVSLAIWLMCLVGVTLKLVMPHRFGRIAILLYLGIGWSGVLLFGDLSRTLSPSALWLLLAGGAIYSLGVIFHLWESLRFQNALWHVAVVIGASLHLAAVMDYMVFSRLAAVA